VQHERKPIVDRKEGIIAAAGGSSTSGGGGSSSTYLSGKSGYQQTRGKGHNVKAEAAATPPVHSTPATPFNLNENLFPMGLNFAELTQTLSKCNLCINPYIIVSGLLLYFICVFYLHNLFIVSLK